VLEPGEPRPRCARSDHRRASHSGRTAPRQSSRATITMRVRVSVTAAASATMSCCSWRQRAIETDWVSRSVTESHGPPIYLKLTFFRLLCVDRLQRTAFPLEGPSGPDRHPPPNPLTVGAALSPPSQLATASRNLIESIAFRKSKHAMLRSPPTRSPRTFHVPTISSHSALQVLRVSARSFVTRETRAA